MPGQLSISSRRVRRAGPGLHCILLAPLLVVAWVSLGDEAILGQTPPVRAPYAAPRTPWGDPDLQGYYTNSDESLIPMERPEALSGRSLAEITPEELARLNEQRNEDRLEADKQRWELRSPLHWFENHNPKNSRAWLVVDPPDGRIPPQTAEARARAAARAKARQGRGEADSYEDRSLYDRCISRGLPGSMMPAIYGNSYEIVQGPGYVAIGYEMVNELRVIPLDGRPTSSTFLRFAPTWAMRAAASRARRSSSRRRTSPTRCRTADRARSFGSSSDSRPVAPNVVEWAVTFDDPATWARPWTFAMNLTKTSRAALRVRLPRRQLCDAKYSRHRPG